MASKYQTITKLASETATRLAADPKLYMAFLKTAGYNFKYSFLDQVLIYAQKPEATACAEIDAWNRLGRWVNRGTRGIALFSEDAGKNHIRYVFDVADTNSRLYKTVMPWVLEHKHERAVREALENSFGKKNGALSFHQFLIETAGVAVEDDLSDYLSDLIRVKEGSLLEELDELNIEVWLKSTLKNSVACMTLARCGRNIYEYFTPEDFTRVIDFNTPETFSILGTAASEIAETILREVAITVRSQSRAEPETLRTFAKAAERAYDKSEKQNSERSADHGADLHHTGRLSDSQPERTGESGVGEIRDAAPQLPEEAPTASVHGDDALGQTEPASGGDRPAGQRDDGEADRPDEGNPEHHGGAESSRPDGMDSADEQHPLHGGGDRNDGADLQLTPILPGVEEQQNTIQEAEDEKTSAFAISQEVIDAVLARGSNVQHSKYRIYEQYLKKETPAENIAFLKKEYGWGGSYPALINTDISEDHDAKGIRLRHSGQRLPPTEVLISWKQAEKRIGQLIEADRYMSEVDKKHYPVYRKNKMAREKRSAVAMEFRSIVHNYNDFVTQLGEDEKRLNLYHLSDCWQRFIAGEKKMYARTTEGDFILPMMREAMNVILADNTHLTERCQSMLLMLQGEVARPLDPSFEELNPPPPTPKEYRLSLGDTVSLGIQDYEILSLGSEEITLFDPAFPLLNKVMPREEFEQKLRENPQNDRYLHAIEAPAEEPEPQQTELLDRAKELIDRFYGSEYDAEADFSNLRQVAIAYTSLTDDEILIEVFADLEEFSIERYLDGNYLDSRQYESLEELIHEELEGLSFDDLVYVEDKYLPQTEIRPPAPVEKVAVTPAVLLPVVPSAQRQDYRITDDNLGVGTPGQRYANNMAAIRLLKRLEEEHRLATPEEQTVLSRYVGWGGLSECFEERHSKYAELKALLSEDEYAAARESTLTAFYTPPVVIRAMYQALENMNFQTGNVLEPSCGTGNFLGLLPDSMSQSKLYGVELDSISGRIARQLYQNASIAIQGYEKTELPDSFFDAAIGNVPFGQFKVADKRYDKHNFLIHDYFFAKTLDKVRPGGIVAFITSKGTMDKENPAVRKYIAQRADLLGAIRLPNDTFKSVAGTEVTSDILFLQKRDRLIDQEPGWVHLGRDKNGLRLNQYFIDNPHMVMGEMKEISGPFGPETACVPKDGQDLGQLLTEAVGHIRGEITAYETDDIEVEEDLSIPADPTVRNFSYTVVDGKLYYRENSRMNPMEVSATAESRIKGMIGIRDCVRRLIEYQSEDYPEQIIRQAQTELNELYDSFCAKYGLINSRANSSAFSTDSSYCLLASLEILDDEGNLLRKADMFSRRTIRKKVLVTSVDTASEALALSLGERAGVDIPYMMELTGKTEEDLAAELKGVIFLNPLHTGEEDHHPKYLPADEYLSGNIREKLALAKRSAELYPEDYAPNVEALEAVQPVDLTASEISVRLGATWLPSDVVEDFMYELFDTPRYSRWKVKVHFSQYSGEWNIEGKSYDNGNIKAYNTYGSDRINGYKILEETLNLRDVRIFDYVEDGSGRRTAVLNKKETAIAQGKQELIKQVFADWIWKDPQRRERLCRLYNEKFNSIRPREYDGSHLNFVGINPEIALRPHQVNAIAHILYGGNTLLAHVVGAGKTFEMVAAAQESKRLGLCQKPLFVVPNHLTEQWASEYLQLYPSANILVATKKDFETRNRKKFCGRIATGDYDAIIIGHSQFEKIPMSQERQQFILEQQLEEIMDGIAELRQNRGDSFSIKQMEKAKKTVQLKLDKLNDQSRKDDLVTFEELGVDRLFIDEAHYYKNLAAFSKMRNVGGISQTEAMKSSDLYMKCRYLDELTDGRGVVFATGTPISNSMVEMYTMQKYLQYAALKRNNLLHFDAWASTFGETVTAIELAPEGTGYRAKTRFARFYNLPELMAMFKEVADIQTADMLNLPVPKANYHSVALKPSQPQKDMVAALSERAERVRNKMVDSSTDNMLLITNDGRKLALDQRLINEMLPDSETGKSAVCARNVYEIWERTAAARSTQMIFCDLSTPHNDGHFNVYDDIRDKLIAKGVPPEEIAYIHTANTEAQKKELFGKVRSGQVRVLLGSTQKMGAGTNVQQKLIALHHIDCPWRPSDLQQREGRIIRQGNENKEVDIYTYVTENTFDSYLYQLVESKQRFIGQIMTSKSPVRAAEDIDETALSYAEIKALCTGNPYIKEKMDLDIAVQRLRLLKASHLSQRYTLEDKIIKDIPQTIRSLEQRIKGYKADMARLAENTPTDKEAFPPMVVDGVTHTEKKAAGTAILAAAKAMISPNAVPLGQYRGFAMEIFYDSLFREYRITVQGELKHTAGLGTDIFGNIQRLDNLLESMPEKLRSCEEQLANAQLQLENAKKEVSKPFPQEEELKAKTARLDELNILLNLDKRENEIVDGDRETETQEVKERSGEHER